MANVKFQHMLNDCSVSLGTSLSPAGDTDKMNLYTQVREGSKSSLDHKLSINLKGKNRVLKEATSCYALVGLKGKRPAVYYKDERSL